MSRLRGCGMSGLYLFADSLWSRHGFGDGDTPEQLLDLCDSRGLEYPEDWHGALCALVERHLIPALPEPVQTYRVGTSHNPIRAKGQQPEWAAEFYVLIPWETVLLEAGAA